MDDPWGWDVDRVVQELCSTNQSWKPPSALFKFPPFEQLEVSLRKEDVDGQTLLTYDFRELSDGLGCKTLKEKSTLKHAIEVLCSQSKHFKQYTLAKKRTFSEFNTDDDPQHVGKEASETGLPYRPVAPAVSTRPALENDVELARSSKESLPSPSQSPAKKKRKLAPTLVSTDLDFTVTRNIPTEADVILTHKPQNTLPQDILTKTIRTQNDTVDKTAGYLGDDALSRIDIIGVDDFSDDEISFQINAPVSSVLRGQRLKVEQVMRRRLLHGSGTRKLHLLKPDMVPGANNPDHDEVLPLYGESDEEYDSETWDEVEAERIERAEAESQPGLNHDIVQATIDNSIQKFVSDWERRKLPKLVKKANQIWVGAREKGLKLSLDRNRADLERCKTRVTKFSNEIARQTWRDEAELRGGTLILQQSVEDREYFSWVLRVIISSDEPEKCLSLPQRRAARKQRQSKPMSADEELLTSESEEELDDFVVNDEPFSHAASPIGSPMSITEDNVEIQTPQGGDIEMRTPKEEDVEMQVPQRDDVKIELPTSNSPKTPRKPFKYDIIDLTTPEKSTPKKNRPSSPLAHAPGVAAAVLPEPTGSLIFSIDDLEPAEQKVARVLSKCADPHPHLVFTLARDIPPMEIWEPLLVDTLEKPEAIRIDINRTARLIFQLWETYRDNTVYSIGLYKNMGYEDRMARKAATEKDLDRFGDFISFLRRLSDRFEWQQEPLQAIDSQLVEIVKDPRHTKRTPPKVPSIPDRDVDIKGDDIQIDGDGSSDDQSTNSILDDQSTHLTPAGKKKRLAKQEVRIHAAELKREADKKRTELFTRRRNKLRATLKQLEASGRMDLVGQLNMMVNVSKDDDQGPICIHPEIAPRIKEHQVEGVRFMWNQVVTSSAQQGCLLAHTMGLGKTMQVITLLVAIAEAANSNDPAISSQIPDDKKKSKTLIVCPPSLLENWLDELLFWAPDNHKLGSFFKVSATETANEPAVREAHISNWGEQGGVLVIGFNLFASLVKEEGEAADILINHPSLVVVDEAHEMKNTTSDLNRACTKIKTQSRIALTGTPLANQVLEYYAMIDWVAPNYLSEKKDFKAVYNKPIEDGLKSGTARGMAIALKKLRVLKNDVAPKMQRATIAAIKDDIPPKEEFVLSMPLTPLQKELYETFVKYHQAHRGELNSRSRGFLFSFYLNSICAHPAIFNRKAKRVESGEDVSVALTPELLSEELVLLQKVKDLYDISLSWKIVVFLTILEECKRVGDSAIVFSHSVQTLDFLEDVLRDKQYSLMRLDGTTNVNNRQNMVKEFNKSLTPSIFLISTKAGGQGFNIVGANRVILFDAAFNPQYEQQAVGRAFRFGQKKKVTVYRLICGGTLEENSLNLQVWKMQLAARVVDKKNPINKAEGLSQGLQLPTDPGQKPLDGYIGRDRILDKVIEKHRPGLRAITTTDVFEEEEVEDAHLTAEDIAEVERLIAENETRRLGNLGKPASSQAKAIADLSSVHTAAPSASPIIPLDVRPEVTAGPSMGFMPPPNPYASLDIPLNPQQDTTANLCATTFLSLRPRPKATAGFSTSHTANSYVRNPPRAPMAPMEDYLGSPQLLQPDLPSAPAESVALGVTDDDDILRASTSKGNISTLETTKQPLDDDMANHHQYPTQKITPSNPQHMVWDNGSAFNGELARLFSRELEQGEARNMAKSITEAVWNSQEPPEVQGQVKQAIIDGASHNRFIQAIYRKMLAPENLASMEAEDIHKQCIAWDTMSTADWDIITKTDSHHRNDGLHMSPTPKSEGHGSRQHKSHREDDRKALKALMERRKANRSSNEKDLRLPKWAIQAVNNGRSSPSPSAGASRQHKPPQQPPH